MSSATPFSTDFLYKYSTLSVDHLKELQAFKEANVCVKKVI